ncbi:MAG TPA: 2-oxoglutarate dehydrogenase E1 component [Thermoanaerobaculia bacterium]|jgi:2-oxoglutarate dehydrogenase E1 component|nr:2-oxoglutarate dehydrogenase E1 component [Thermoanaerobaculia bacterium]
MATTTTEDKAAALLEDRPKLDPKTLNSFRRLGFLQADLDPLGRLRPEPQPALEEEADPPTAAWARRRYCGTIGAEFMHIPQAERRRWIAERLETEPAPPDRDRVLGQIMSAETFEQLLQTRYQGSKRFSIEGVAALIPALDAMLERAAAHQGVQVVLAMSHRGRLSVMLNVVGRPAAQIFARFDDVDARSVLGAGDVKYHMGATGTFKAGNGREVDLHLVSNPSHLEAVDPVAVGRVRAKQARLGDHDFTKVMPVVLHGDAAFAGQGILAETLNLADLDGYRVGGTVHVIVNNLIGFTTEPRALHSSRFASDVAKRLPIPIFHVNGEDPDAVVRVAALAVDYRYAFQSDVVVDLIGYRRYGHSEVDDPTITQPLLYKQIASHPPLWQIYAQRSGVAEPEAERRAAAVRAELDAAQEAAKKLDKKPPLRTLPAYWDRYRGGPYRPEYEVKTGLAGDQIGELTAPLTSWPETFHIHKKIESLLKQRAEMGAGKRPFDYGMAEALAFASLVRQGTPVRLSGQDSRRGTFAHRHSVLIDVENGAEYTPLAHVAADQARFEVYDSMLSEAAVLGFEYGYSRDFPEALVLWEAQFGDFANGAQIVVDQFLAAAENKWNLLSGVVMLLPHGYEGQGPEHSSARLERYLQLAAEDNIQVCQPSTAAQYFHLLRRQALSVWRKPLVTLTPKSMLRHRDSSSPLADFTRDHFLRVVPDHEVEDAHRVLFCTGKIAHELRRERERRQDHNAKATAILALDQVYPLPKDEIVAELARHPNCKDVVWVQEEPANMGALFYVHPRLESLAGRRVRSVRRHASGSPATGSAKAHLMEQQTLLALAFTTGG